MVVMVAIEILLLGHTTRQYLISQAFDKKIIFVSVAIHSMSIHIYTLPNSLSPSSNNLQFNTNCMQISTCMTIKFNVYVCVCGFLSIFITVCHYIHVYCT